MKTKKFILPLAAVIVTLAVILVACGAKATPTATTGGAGAPERTGTPGARFNNQPLPLAELLGFGTLKLQGTSNAVNASQAAALVPLCRLYRC